ncbi:MAG TPA: hypothetical protein PKD48_01765 [Sphingopyxis sp.]|nr:hypothetical protein [Sphingopyxis sp.]
MSSGSVRKAALVAMLMAGAGQAQAFQKPEKLSKAERAAALLTSQQVAARVKITGTSELDPVMWISTEPFLEHRYATDKFWRAMINKETGAVTYQVYFKLQTPRSQRLSKLTYAIGGRLQSIPLTRIHFDVSCHRYGCTHYEDFIGEFPKEHVEEMANAANSTDTSVTVKVFGDLVTGEETAFFRTELAGLLIATEARAAEYVQPAHSGDAAPAPE